VTFAAVSREDSALASVMRASYVEAADAAYAQLLTSFRVSGVRAPPPRTHFVAGIPLSLPVPFVTPSFSQNLSEWTAMSDSPYGVTMFSGHGPMVTVRAQAPLLATPRCVG
jgi:hypothetical protein